MIIPANQGCISRYSFHRNNSFLAAISLLMVLLFAGCSGYTDYVRQPLIIDARPPTNNSASAVEQSQSNLNNQRNTQEHARDNHVQNGYPGLPSQQRTHNWPDPQAQESYPIQGISKLESEYVVYEPTNPNADEYGYIHLTIRSASPPAQANSKARWKDRTPMTKEYKRPLQNQASAKREVVYDSYDFAKRNTADRVPAGMVPAADYNREVNQVNPTQARVNKPSEIQRFPMEREISNSVNEKKVNFPDKAAIPSSKRPRVTNVSVTESREQDNLNTVASKMEAKSLRSENGKIMEDFRNDTAESREVIAHKSDFRDDVFVESKQYNDQISQNAILQIPQTKSNLNRNKRDIPAVNISGKTNIQRNDIIQPAIAEQKFDYTPRAYTIDKTISDLERYVISKPQEVNAQLALRLLYSINNGNKALEQLPNLSEEDQSQAVMLTRAMLLTTKAGQISGQNKPEAAHKAMLALNQLSEKISENVDIIVSCLKICSKVGGFGQYDTMSLKELESGKVSQVLVYCELQNVKAELNEEGKYFTRLHADITLYDAAFRPLSQIREEVEDTPSFNRRRDFFLRGPLNIPRLSPGKYEIVVTIEDKIARKISLPNRFKFEVKDTGQGGITQQ